MGGGARLGGTPSLRHPITFPILKHPKGFTTTRGVSKGPREGGWGRKPAVHIPCPPLLLPTAGLEPSQSCRPMNPQSSGASTHRPAPQAIIPMPGLYDVLRLGALTLPNRILMATPQP